ncbi:hypothetical protein NW211_08805 [Barnesiella sp. ET7]|uniref:hypothetical protein n=1 Tax=Barnesiella sp. ET7 TaxID=2972460 RepID=UPI0021ABABAD|nr:hypothetical protein [Barnesiella sp. ET7]MCR8912098.1 hypothetical protein [Barnesiella sp. ET7]
MKKIFLLLTNFIIYTHGIAQCYDEKRTYDVIGLAKGNEISECLIKGLPFLLIGLFLLCYNIKYSQIAKKENKEEKGSWSGCLSLILIGIAVLIMLPLLAWIEAILVSIISILAVLGIIILIWGWIKK